MSPSPECPEPHLTAPSLPSAIVVMGVSGSGKTTIARALAERLGHGFMDADDLHPPANRARLAAGIALTDADRAPWLAAIASAIAARLADGSRIVVACSALKRSYRKQLRDRLCNTADLVFVHLDLDRATLAQRLRLRRGHFMSQSLLDDQLATLQPPAADERAITIRPVGSVADTVAQAVCVLRQVL